MGIVTRFAPSPTGNLHIGGARTALFNYIFAKSNNGIFKLRIEDTDKIRNNESSIHSIINGLGWLGLSFEKNIIYQSENKNKHVEIANKMIEKGFAYKCFHNENEINIKKNKNKKFISDWRDRSVKHPVGKPFSIRIKTSTEGKTFINDKIQGKVEIDNSEIDDYVIIRSDGTPTFLLSSAIDDYLMNVTHIIRGDDHLTNSLRQMIIFHFLNYNPTFAHMSLIHNEQNKKLSKRDNVLSIDDYKSKGYLAESLVNYMLRMGWSLGDKEIISLDDALKSFKLERVGKSPSILDNQKLLFLNNHYLKNTDSLALLNHIRERKFFNKSEINKCDYNKILNAIDLFKDRCETLVELYDYLINLNKGKFLLNNNDKIFLTNNIEFKTLVYNELNSVDNWDEKEIGLKLNYIAKKLEIGFKKLAQPLRLCLLGSLNGPSVSSLLEIIGKESSLKKILTNWN